MLWYKGWFETRFKLLSMLAFTVLFLSLLAMRSVGARGSVSDFRPIILMISTFSVPFPIVMTCAILAGTGIATQPSFQASKGLHGSTLFTLSMPESRLRLLSVRAFIGWLEMAAVIGVLCFDMWLAMPMLRDIATPFEMFEQAGTLIAGNSIVYFFSVLLGTVLDDQWRVWGTMFVSLGAGWLCMHGSLPAFANILHGIANDSPIVAHTIPWNVIAFSLGLSAILFVAALKVAQRREY
jgi:hypothetical protein